MLCSTTHRIRDPGPAVILQPHLLSDLNQKACVNSLLFFLCHVELFCYHEENTFGLTTEYMINQHFFIVCLLQLKLKWERQPFYSYRTTRLTTLRMCFKTNPQCLGQSGHRHQLLGEKKLRRECLLVLTASPWITGKAFLEKGPPDKLANGSSASRKINSVW